MGRMVRLDEHESKILINRAGISIPTGGVSSSAKGVRKIAEKIGKPVVIKAQMLVTGRFKAGGIKFAKNPEEAEEVAEKLLGLKVKGQKVQKLRVEERLDIKKEYYVGIITDSSYRIRSPVVMFSTRGGVDVEKISTEFPEDVSRMTVNVFRGFRSYDAYNLVLRLRVPKDSLSKIGAVMCKLYEVFERYDARSAEINPLVLTKDGSVVAADCRIAVDDSSLGRHRELQTDIPVERNRPPTQLERIAWSIEEGDYRGITFFAQMIFDMGEKGCIGYHGIGGGGAILGVDALARHGLKIADYAESSGNPPASKVYRLAKIILSQPAIEGYFLGGFAIANQEQWHHALGLVKAMREDLKDRPGFPVVIVIAGNKEKESISLLKEGLKGLPIRLEIYGREHVYDTDFVSSRMRCLVNEYRKDKMGKRCIGDV